jgi:carboxyl-terminal processing protease
VGKDASDTPFIPRYSNYVWLTVIVFVLNGCATTQTPVVITASLLTEETSIVVPVNAQPPTETEPQNEIISTPTSLATATPQKSPSVIPTASPTQTSTAAPLPSVLAVDERLLIFEEVWRTVASNYLYEDFRGVDWDEMYELYQPQIKDSETSEQFYSLIGEMIDQLDDQHSRFLPPSNTNIQDASTIGYDASVGIGVVTQPKADGAFIQWVYPDSPAARADLRPRDRIIAVNGRPYNPQDGDLQGPDGTTVRLNVIRPGDKPRDVVLIRQEIQGRISPYYRRFPDDIGYVMVPTLWVNDMDEQVSGALTELMAEGRLRGLILDLRGNGGGWSKVLSGILGHFVRGQVGTFISPNGMRPLVIEPAAGPDLRGIPVVVLIDSGTASYAELIAAILQNEMGALAVGTPSAGNTETIYAYTLRDGSRLWLAQESFKLQNGQNLEGLGVQPDSLIDIDWTHYSEEDDPQLLEALHLLGAGPK